MALLKQRLNLNVLLPETIEIPEIFPSSFSKSSILSSTPTHNQEVEFQSDLEVVQVLGSGHAGTVYKVCRKQTLSVYALKVFRGCFGDHQEIKILRSLDSPFIVGFRGVFENNTEGEVAMLLEFMEGGSLENLVKTEGSLSETVIKKIAYQALMGLNYLHSRGIVHCDIKPSNLLVDKEMRIKIADFDVSKMVTASENSCKTYQGTAAYMSPERFDPDTYGCNAFAGDVWSLGLTFMELYIGHYPYLKPGEKADSTAFMWEICMEEPPRLPEHASEAFKDFIGCCLQKDLSKRWSVSQLLQHPFVESGRSDESLKH